MANPLVSVVLPTVRRVEFLEGAIDSVLGQTYENLECIVVDGASSDGTAALLESVDDDRLCVLSRNRPRGLSDARNAGISAARGQYVLFLDDDDWLYETAVRRLVDAVRERPPSCAGAYGDYREVDRTRLSRKTAPPTAARETPVSDPGDDHSIVGDWESASIGGPSCSLLRAEVLEEVGQFDESIPAMEDVDLWIRVFANYAMVEVDEVLYARGTHPQQMTRDLELMVEGNERLVEKYEGDLSRPKLADLRSSLGYKYARLGDTRRARAEIESALALDPRRTLDYCGYCCLLFGSVGYRIGRRINAAVRRGRSSP